MPAKSHTLVLALASTALLALSGCGGSDEDGGGNASGPATPPTAVTLSGIAATGAAFTDAVVTVVDSTGATAGSSSSVGSNGIFNVTLSPGAKAPYVLLASRTTADGEVQSLVSVLESATATTTNITPVTNLIAARLSPSGNPVQLASELASGAARVTPEAVAATVQEVRQILASLLAATGTSAIDPLKGSFAVDGTGYDRLLDSLQISIVAASPTASNIEVAVKQKLADGVQPTAVRFASTARAVAPLPAIDPATLVEPKTSALMADLLKTLTACYALPLAERINTGGSGTPADITAPGCRSVFFGNDPAVYRSNGSTVGLNRSFNGIYVNGGTGVLFSQGNHEFTRSNGDLVMGYKTRDAAGNENFDTLVVRKDTDGKLKAVGNQYQYPGGVSAFHQYRQFITLNQSTYNYHSTGYSLNISDVRGGAGVGQSIFDRVVVTAPNGTPVTLQPGAGLSQLNLVKPSGVSGTNFIRLRSVFANDAMTGNISAIDSTLFFSPVARTDADLEAIAAQGVWSFAYFLAGNTGATADATQYYRSRSRALSIRELRLKGLAQLTGEVVNAIGSTPGLLEGQVPLPTNRPLENLQFTVPATALPVTQIRLFGRLGLASNGPRFDDAVVVRATARTGTVLCTPASNADLHCGAAGAYAANAYFNGLQLLARDTAGREYGSFYAAYRLTLP